MKLAAAVLLACAALAAAADGHAPGWAEYWETHEDRGFVTAAPDKARYGRGGLPPLLDATNAVPTNVVAYTSGRGLTLTASLRDWALREDGARPLAELWSGDTVVFDCTLVPEGCFDVSEAGQTMGAWTSRVVVASEPVARALLGASVPRVGTVLPVYVDHDATKRAGDVLALFYERGRGVVARVRLAVAPGVEPASAYAGRSLSAAVQSYTATKADAFGAVTAILPVRILEVSLVREPALPTRRDKRALVPEDLVHALPTRIPK